MSSNNSFKNKITIKLFAHKLQTHTYTHTHTYIYIYTERERERERERENLALDNTNIKHQPTNHLDAIERTYLERRPIEMNGERESPESVLSACLDDNEALLSFYTWLDVFSVQGDSKSLVMVNQCNLRTITSLEALNFGIKLPSKSLLAVKRTKSASNTRI